jgi:hypothetical protein
MSRGIHLENNNQGEKLVEAWRNRISDPRAHGDYNQS